MQAPGSPGGNVMTQAELDVYQKRKDQERAEKHSDDSEDEDNINYDSDDDGKTGKQSEQRRRQEAHIAGYRQQMMKTTNGQPFAEPRRIPSLQGPWVNIPDEDDDDDVPLAMLQARSQQDRLSRLAGVRSNPNLRASAQQQLMRPGSAQGKRDNGSRLQLPSFASHLPQDPFQDPYPDPFQDPFQANKRPMFSGGLISVIANEERAKASRRGSPNGGFQPSHSPTYNGFGLTNGSPYMAAPYGMPMAQQVSRPGTPSSGFQMQQQIPKGIQDQMQLLQMMSFGGQPKPNNPWNGNPPQRPGTSASVAPPLKTSSVPAYGGYAQSIPPSERSNVGLPSRYRPVSKPKA